MRRRSGIVQRLRTRASTEPGYTLIELLVAVLIVGTLAAIAIPAFMNQKNKASDVKAKAEARSMSTAMETCATDNQDGTFAGCDLPRLMQIETTFSADADVLLANGSSYTVQSAPATTSENVFRILKVGGDIDRECTLGSGSDAGGCNIGGQEPAEGVDGTW